MNPKVNIANTQHAAQMYARGMTPTTIGAILGVSVKTVYNYCRKQGVPVKKTGWLCTITEPEAVAIAKEYGYNPPFHWAMREPKPRNPTRAAEVNWDHVERLYENEFSVIDIQDFTEVNRMTIFSGLKRRGLLRPRGWRSTVDWPDKLKIAAELGYANPFAR